MEKNNHNIWVEKYRPVNLDTFIISEELKNTFNTFIVNNNIPHLLFYSSDPGVGKTTLSKILAKNIDCDKLYINASDNNGVDFIRERIKPFAQSIGNKDLKIIILDEFDFTTPNFQAALRNLMESTYQSTRFILTCNYIDKIIEPIISRCQLFKMEPPSVKDVAKHMEGILKAENIEYDRNNLGQLILSNYPDIRRTINALEKYSITGELKITSDENSDYRNIKDVIIKNIKENTDKSFVNIRQAILDAGVKGYDSLYSELYKSIDNFCNNDNIGDVIEVIADYSYKSSFIVDKEITFMACIYKILSIVKQEKRQVLNG